MTEQQKRSGVMALWEQGTSKKQIGRLLELNVKTVRSIIAAKGQPRAQPSRRCVLPPREAMAQLFRRCKGYVQRMHEVLREEEDLHIGYSTLCRAVRELGLDPGDTPQRAAHVPDQPGQEMQHDTSVYSIVLGDSAPVKLVCSGLYLRYSKMRYVKFYRSFNRFRMKCFVDQALRFWGHSAQTCIIDNTSLAVHAGHGADALFSAEMVAFANAYGFRWIAHALGHANRKAGTERSFWTLETNFFPGRSFTCLEDLNAQALQWATQRYAQRPQSHTGLIPVELFEYEKPFLRALPDFISPPTQPHQRTVDPYGYIRFDSNFFWVPKGPKTVCVVEYDNRIVIYAQPDRQLIEYPLPADGVRKQPFAPKDHPGLHRHPRNLKPGCQQQEQLLRQKHPSIEEYLDFIRSNKCSVRYKPQFIRQLYQLSTSCDDTVLLALIQRALQFRVCSMDALLRIAVQIANVQPAPWHGAMPSLPTAAQDYQQRQEYQAGEISTEHPLDPSLLDNLTNTPEDPDGPIPA